MLEVVIISCVITLILLKFFLNIKISKIKKMEAINSSQLEFLSNKFPNEEQICKDILKKINNNTEVKIKVDDKYNSCLYTILNNTIIIGKFKQNYMKVQTIAHECIHSCQEPRILWGNFIFSNIYLMYFWTILILKIFNKLPFESIHSIVLIFLGIVQYIIRANLENDAMIKARFIAKEYIEDKKFLSKVDMKNLLIEYDRINKIGIPFMNFYLISKNLIKCIIFTLLSVIF